MQAQTHNTTQITNNTKLAMAVMIEQDYMHIGPNTHNTNQTNIKLAMAVMIEWDTLAMHRPK
jgi:hypothetical protein